MNKDEFLQMTLEKQVDYINTQLQQGVSFNQVIRDLNLPKTTIFNRINKFYRKEGNAYVPIEALNNYHAGTGEALAGMNVPGDRLGMSPHMGMMREILESVRKLENEFEEMKKITSPLESPKVAVAESTRSGDGSLPLVVDLPRAIANYTSFQVNKEVLNRWYSFVRRQHGFSGTDLVSMALKEFMDRYED